MSQGYAALTEKEKQTLRLIVRGHDAKSTARELGLSVHTINERLRDARRKLAVSSSREAARRLLDAEASASVSAPDLLGDKLLGADPEAAAAEPAATPGRRWPALAGVAVMTLALGMLAFALVPHAADSSATKSDQVAALEAEVTQAARDWLALGDEARWEEAWRGTGATFRQLNTLARWTEVSQEVRVPLGPVLSREMLTHDSVPTPPAGAEVVKFRTDFEGRRGVIETVSLAREDGVWKVTGIYLDWPD
jgi:DNA-binding CsgD family transcriptional regulator